jgi:hypothetical protein
MRATAAAHLAIASSGLTRCIRPAFQKSIRWCSSTTRHRTVGDGVGFARPSNGRNRQPLA